MRLNLKDFSKRLVLGLFKIKNGSLKKNHDFFKRYRGRKFAVECDEIS